MTRSRDEMQSDRERLLRAIPDAWTATADLSVAMESDHRKVFADCRWLEKQGYVESRLKKGSRRIFYCVDCEEVLTAKNYAECRGGDIRPFNPEVREWQRTRSGLRFLRERDR